MPPHQPQRVRDPVHLLGRRFFPRNQVARRQLQRGPRARFVLDGERPSERNRALHRCQVRHSTRLEANPLRAITGAAFPGGRVAQHDETARDEVDINFFCQFMRGSSSQRRRVCLDRGTWHAVDTCSPIRDASCLLFCVLPSRRSTTYSVINAIDLLDKERCRTGS